LSEEDKKNLKKKIAAKKELKQDFKKFIKSVESDKIVYR